MKEQVFKRAANIMDSSSTNIVLDSKNDRDRRVPDVPATVSPMDASRPLTAIDAEMMSKGSAMPEYYFWRTSRSYNANDGSLMQGSTAFFSMKQPLIDSVEQ